MSGDAWLLVAGAVGLIVLIVMWISEKRRCEEEARELAELQARAAVLSRSFRCGGGK